MQQQYKDDFFMPKRPQRIWDQDGHCIFMHYKKGARGRVVDESYMLTVRRFAEKTMKRYRINSSINVRPQSGTIVVSFFRTSFSSWRKELRSGPVMARSAIVHGPHDRLPEEEEAPLS